MFLALGNIITTDSVVAFLLILATRTWAQQPVWNMGSTSLMMGTEALSRTGAPKL